MLDSWKLQARLGTEWYLRCLSPCSLSGIVTLQKTPCSCSCGSTGRWWVGTHTTSWNVFIPLLPCLILSDHASTSSSSALAAG